MELAAYMKEKFRPGYHYTAERDQINDPNGLIYLNGKWQMYHQYNLFGAVHWGHAVSEDLIHWRHLEPAIYPDFHDQIWSGTSVTDEKNTAGFGENALVAAFTYGGSQSQGIAYSTDGGEHFSMYEGNPVLKSPGKKDFRDPRIFRYTKGQEEKWVMILAAGKNLDFYESRDLKNWTYLSSWGEDYAGGITFECPDCFCLLLNGEEKWVIVASTYGENERNHGHAVIYAVGNFDGKEFHCETEEKQYMNFGMDYYAPQTFYHPEKQNNTGRRIAVSWQDNWEYRELLTTAPFNGQMGILKEFSLVDTEKGARLIQKPLKEYDTLKAEPYAWKNGQVLLDGHQAYGKLTGLKGAFSLEILDGETPLFRLKKQKDVYTVCRRGGEGEGLPCFAHEDTAKDELSRKEIDLEIFLDESSVELICDGGRIHFSELLLPKGKDYQVRLLADEGYHASFFRMKEIWEEERQKAGALGEWEICSGKWARTINGLEGSDEAFALLSGPERKESGRLAFWACMRGVKDTSMTSILGEKSLGADLGGLTVTFDYEEQCILWGEEKIPCRLVRNQPIQAELEWDGKKCSLFVDQKRIGEQALPKEDGKLGLFVKNGLAAFSGIEV